MNRNRAEILSTLENLEEIAHKKKEVVSLADSMALNLRLAAMLGVLATTLGLSFLGALWWESLIVAVIVWFIFRYLINASMDALLFLLATLGSAKQTSSPPRSHKS